MLEKISGSSRSQDTIQDALGGPGSASDSSSGIKGHLAREAFLKQVGDLKRVSRAMKTYVSQRVPFAEHRVLGHVAARAAAGWETGHRTSRSCSSDVAGQASSGAEAVQPTLCSTVAGGEPGLPKGPGLCRDSHGSDRVKDTGPRPAANSRGEGRPARARETASPAAPEPPKGRQSACVNSGSRVGVLETSPSRAPAASPKYRAD